MKRVIWGLVLLLSIISVSAAYFPQPGVIFEFKGTECSSNGTIVINLTHEGNSVAFKAINFTVESDEFSPIPVIGEWLLGSYDYAADNYTGNDFFGKTKFRFKTTNNVFTKGDYIITLNWPSNSLYEDKIKFAVSCPGISCNSDLNCISQQSCTNQTCQWIKCPEDKMAMGHTCLPKCNDYDECTNDYFIDEQCVHVKIDPCIVKEGKAQVEFESILSRFWNWLTK